MGEVHRLADDVLHPGGMSPENKAHGAWTLMAVEGQFMTKHWFMTEWRRNGERVNVHEFKSKNMIVTG